MARTPAALTLASRPLWSAACASPPCCCSRSASASRLGGPGIARADGDRLARRQLHLRRGRALARQRLGTARDALGDRPRRLSTAARSGLRLRPGADLRRQRGERLPPLRRGADPRAPRSPSTTRSTSPAPGARLANLWPAAWAARPHFGEPPQADQLAAVARRDRRADGRGHGRRQRRRLRRAGRRLRARLGPQRRGRSASSATAKPRRQIEAALPRAMRRVWRGRCEGVRRTMAAAGYARSGLPPGRRWATPRRSRRAAGSATPRTAGAGSTEGGCPVWNADADWAAGPTASTRWSPPCASGGGRGRRRVPRPPPRPRRPPALRPPLAPRRRRRALATTGAEWVRRLSFVQGSTRESLHPNAYGQRAIGACIGAPLRAAARRLRRAAPSRPAASLRR